MMSEEKKVKLLCTMSATIFAAVISSDNEGIDYERARCFSTEQAELLANLLLPWED